MHRHSRAVTGRLAGALAVLVAVLVARGPDRGPGLGTGGLLETLPLVARTSGGGSAGGGASGAGAGGSAGGGAAGGGAAGGGLVAGLGAGKVAAVAAAGTVVVGAGVGAVYVYQQEQSTVDLSGVPDDVDTVAYTDVDKLTDDEAIRTLVDEVLALSESEEVPDDYAELQADFDEETGLELEKADSVLSYSRIPDPDAEQPEEYSGVIVRSDWAEDDFVRAYEDTDDYDVEYEAGDYEGVSVYRPAGEMPEFASTTWIGVLGDGTFVVGTPDAVEDAIDVDQGNADPLSGDLKKAFRNARGGYVKTASRVPGSEIPDDDVSVGPGSVNTGPFKDVDIVTAAYYTTGNSLGAEVTLLAESESAAGDVADVIDGVVSLGSGTIENEEMESALRDVEVTQDGKRVVVRFEDSVEDITAVLEAAKEQSEESEGDESTETAARLQAGVSVFADNETLRVTWTSNLNAEYLVVVMDPETGEQVRKRLDDVGTAAYYEGQSGERVDVTVIAHGPNGRETVITTRSVTL